MTDVQERYADKFVILVRYMILAAEDKRFVTYAELNKLLGVSIEDLRDFAGFLGDFCDKQGYPYLNSLIINSTDGMPGQNYFLWLQGNITNWAENIAKCFSTFHVTLNQKKLYANTSGLNDVIAAFLINK